MAAGLRSGKIDVGAATRINKAAERALKGLSAQLRGNRDATARQERERDLSAAVAELRDAETILKGLNASSDGQRGR